MKRFRLANETQRDMALTWLRAVPLREPLEILVQTAKSKRSLEQNKKMHALIAEIAEQTPWSAEAFKEFFRREFIGVEEIILPSGEIISRGISTTTLNVSECADFITRIEHYAVDELGVELAA